MIRPGQAGAARVRDVIHLLCCAALLAAGCRATVRDLEPGVVAAARPEPELPFRDVVAVRVRSDGEPAPGAGPWQRSLSSWLRDANLFAEVVGHGEAGRANWTLEGVVGGAFDDTRRANALTWFPGPLIFAQSWRGSIYRYRARARLELVERDTGRRAGPYRAGVAMEFQHRSASPAHFLGTLLIVPSVVKASLDDEPRSKARTLLYRRIYPELWRRVLAELVADRAGAYRERARWRALRCGEHLDAAPVPGQPFEAFRDCQTGLFRLLRQEQSEEGPRQVYQRLDGGLHVQVAGGRVLGWFGPAQP